MHLAAGVTTPERVSATTRTAASARARGERFPGVAVTSAEEDAEANLAAAAEADVMVLGVKPQDIVATARQVAGGLRPETVVVSVAAGVRAETIAAVLPDADVNVFLTASPEARALRRNRQLVAAGGPDDYDAVLESVRRRDHLDSTRAASPLRPADDARVVDTSDMAFDDVVRLLTGFAHEKTGAVR